MLQFAWPWLLLLLPFPWLARRYLPNAARQSVSALKIPFFSQLKPIAQPSSKRSPHWRLSHYLAYLCWGLLILAAAGPQWLGAPLLLPQSGRDILFAVDLSGSMQTPDMQLHGKQVDRLTIIKNVASDFIKQREGDRLGLILFGSKAYLQTPLTFDRNTVQNMLDDATIGLAGTETAIGDAIGLAIKHLQKSQPKNRVLILLTDGANNAGTVSPLAAAVIAAKQNIRIYTVGIGSDALTIEGLFGPTTINLPTELDVATLQSIAKTTGGMFFRAKDTASLKNVYSTLDKLEPVASSQAVLRPITPLYMWPLATALLLSVWIALSRRQ